MKRNGDYLFRVKEKKKEAFQGSNVRREILLYFISSVKVDTAGYNFKSAVMEEWDAVRGRDGNV